MSTAEQRGVNPSVHSNPMPVMPPTSIAPASPSQAEIDDYWRQSRLSLPDVLRIPLAAAASFTVGMSLGVAQGSTMAGMRFRAEHAHKLPKTTAGWYLYHKSKNYHAAYGGVREGLRMGARVSFWTTATCAVESLFDHYRGAADLANTVLACVAVAGGFSLWNRFPMATAARTTKTAIVVGFVYGGVQDIAGLARGRRISYVEFLKRRFRSEPNNMAGTRPEQQQQQST